MPLHRVGRIDQPHGLDGEVKVLVDAASVDALVRRSHWFIGFATDSVLHVKVERTKRAGAGASAVLIAKLSCARSRTEADRFKGAMVLLPDVEAVASSEAHPPPIGYRVFDEKGNKIGVVDDYREMPAQDLLVVRRPNGKEVMIPNVEPIVTSMDEGRQEVHIRVVEGLLDV